MRCVACFSPEIEQESKAFGLNRSEMFTRQGHSLGVVFPRVLGIECVGVVEAAAGINLHAGAICGKLKE